MGAIRRKFTKEFKEAAVRRLELGASLAEVARASEVNANVLHRWRRELRDHGTKAFAGNGQRRADESRVAELERKVGRQALEIDFLERCLQDAEEKRRLPGIDFAGLVYPFVEKEMSLATPIALERLCELALVSRAGFYRWRNAPAEADPDMDLRDEIQRIALEFPYYGRPRVARELKDRGWQANHKRVYRIMREDNLLCLRRRKFVVATTNSNHNRPVYPNLARGMVPTDIDQLWVADITYIRLDSEFVYLAAILDAFSRRVIGWALDRTLEDELTIAALRMALAERNPAPGLVHHSDRGVQYASGDYTDLLKAQGITISMSRKGNPYDNAICESFMKTLKYDEVPTTGAAPTVSLVQDKANHAVSLVAKECRDPTDARASIGRFLEKIYNGKRLHSALNYRSPVEFERSLPATSSQPVPQVTA